MIGPRSTSAAQSLLRAAATSGSRQQAPRYLASAAASTSSSHASSYSAAPSSSSSHSRLAPERMLHTSPVRTRPTKKSDRRGQEEAVEEATPAFNARLTPKAAQDVDSVQSWLRSAFPGLPFPNDVALQLVTHESWDHGVSAGHSRRLGFMGRRALKFFLSLFIATHGGGRVALSNDRIEELLHTSKLGDHVGRSLRLEEVMRWTPAVNDGQQGPKETGLFKIRGVCVEALVGAIYHQHGAQAARAFFASRVLPKLGTFTDEEREVVGEALSREADQGDVVLRSMAEETMLKDSATDGEEEWAQRLSAPSATAEKASAGAVEEVGAPVHQAHETVKAGVNTSPQSPSPMRRRSKAGTAGAGLTLEEEVKPARSFEGSVMS